MEDLAENEGRPRSAFRRQCDGVLPTDQQLVVLETIIDRIRTEAAEEQESGFIAWIREVFEDVVGWQMGVQAAQAGGEIVFVDADGGSVARDPKRRSATFQLLRWKFIKSLSEIPALDMPRLCNKDTTITSGYYKDEVSYQNGGDPDMRIHMLCAWQRTTMDYELFKSICAQHHRQQFLHLYYTGCSRTAQ